MLHRLLPVILTFALFGSACANSTSDTSVGSPVNSSTTTIPKKDRGDGTVEIPTTTTTTPAPEAPAGDRGWLEGEDLDWSVGDGDGDAAYAELASADSAASAGTVTPSPISPPIKPPRDNSPLAAGSINDADDVDAYLRYRRSIADAGVATRKLDVSDSTVITVLGSSGLPVIGAQIEFWDPTADSDAPMVSLSTTATGSARFLPGAIVGGEQFERFDVDIRLGDTKTRVSFDRGEAEVDVDLDTPGGVDKSVPLDIHFVLDATGSMEDEIARLRENMTSISQKIAALQSRPDVRFGMTVYRDQGDLFVTRTFDLTDDLGSFIAALADVEASGGGDYPEAMDEALADALENPEWRRDGAVGLMFLIADAPPQIGRAVQQPYTTTALGAAANGIKIFPVAASGTDDQAEYTMRELAFVTGGRFVFLSYGVNGAATGAATDITADDYDELPLDQLVVELVRDELAALTGQI